MSNEQTKPNFLVPWTCPKCGALCDEVANYKDYEEAVGYFQECDECGCEFTHWENVTYEPYCAEVDGVEYEYPKGKPADDPRALDVLAEFVDDVDACGTYWTQLHWPDLLVTYRKAKSIVNKIDPVTELAKAPADSEILVDYGLLDDQIEALARAHDKAKDGQDADLLNGLIELLVCIYHQKPFKGVEAT